MDTKRDNQEAECQKVSGALSAHFDGEANEAEQQLATAHLVHCQTCARMWGEWQVLRSMEQRALEPVNSNDLLPLAPVKVPLHLKSAILRQTVSVPIWQRLWPRVLTGMAVPAFALGCWLLIVTAPWQQSMPETGNQSGVVPQERIAGIPQISSDTLDSSKSTDEKTAEILESRNDNIAVSKISEQPSAISNKNRVSSEDSPSVAVTNPRSSARLASVNTNKGSAKSTFKQRKSSSTSVTIKSPQISMASLEQPSSRATKSIIKVNRQPIPADAPQLRATAPTRVAQAPIVEPVLMAQETEDSFDPLQDFYEENDVRPESIRIAVENYRAALLGEDADL